MKISKQMRIWTAIGRIFYRLFGFHAKNVDYDADVDVVVPICACGISAEKEKRKKSPGKPGDFFRLAD